MQLSVRGEARQEVAPDVARIEAGVTVGGPSKVEALDAVAAVLGHLTDDLLAVGAVVHTLERARAPITWSAWSATTSAERLLDPETGRMELTGRVHASVQLSIRVRDLASLDDLGRVLAAHGDLDVRHVAWMVDADNPGWAQVRATAIHTAIAKARDYAAALGVSLVEVEVEAVADTGLLAGSGDVAQAQVRARSAGMRGGGEVPSLDPVPQELTATIEARVRTTAVTL